MSGSQSSSRLRLSGERQISPRSSRRGSQVSSTSSGGLSRSKSLFSSNGGGTVSSSGPVIQGNLQVLSGIDCGDQVLGVTHNESGTTLVAALSSGQLKVFSPSNSALLLVLDSEEVLQCGLPVSRVRCKPNQDGQPNSLLAATYSSGHLRMWNYGSGQCVAQVQDENVDAEYLCLSYNPFVEVISVGMDNGHIKLYDERTMQVVSLLHKSQSPFKIDGHTNRVLCIANHPSNPHEFVSSGWDNTLQFWDARCPHAVRSVFGVFSSGEAIHFDHRKGREFTVASWRPEKQLQTFDFATGKIIQEIEPQQQQTYLTCIQNLGKSHYLIGGTNRGCIRVVDKQKRCTVASIEEIPNVYAVSAAHAGAGATAKRGGGGGGGGGAASGKFVMTSNNNIIVAEFK